MLAFSFTGRLSLARRLVLLSWITGGLARAEQEIPATIVPIGDVSSLGLIEAARQEQSAAWRIDRLVPAHLPPVAVPRAEIQAAIRAYVEADFLRCLTLVQSSALDLERLLEQRHRDPAAQLATVAAACAHGAGDELRARELVRRMLVRELDAPAILKRTTPDFQAVAEDERRALQRLTRISVEVQSSPTLAAIYVDGVLRCRQTPCRIQLIPGEHVVVGEAVGRRPRALTVVLEDDQKLTLALDEAPADEVRRHLGAAIASGTDPASIDISRAAAAAFAARVLVLVWLHKGRAHATLYDRAIDRLVAHVALDDRPNALPAAVRAVVHEWRGNLANSRPILKQPAFWFITAGVALVSGAVVWFVTRPMEVRHDIVFR
jgi:hypothetical protein